MKTTKKLIVPLAVPPFSYIDNNGSPVPIPTYYTKTNTMVWLEILTEKLNEVIEELNKK
jgi:hypothetical protein